MSNRQRKERRRQARLAAERTEAQRTAHRRDLTTIGIVAASLAAIVVAVVLVVSHRNDSGTRAAPVAAAPVAATPGVPRQIAANKAQGNQIVDGSIQDKLAQLKGVPVVVNQWASWCPNCKQEFPFFQRLAHTYEKRVAFVGLDSQDNRGDAQAFLKAFPVTYSSIYDSSAAQARSIGGGQGWPTTFFYDRTGRQTYVRQGGYTSLELLRADIQRYALGATS
jgi:thiol-disulfide isomerase/thioredoxin